MIIPDDHLASRAWDLVRQYPQYPQGVVIIISIVDQVLHLLTKGDLAWSSPVSTSRYGVGSQSGSRKTPLGLHYIREKIGQGAPLGTVFVGRHDMRHTAPIITEPVKTAHDHITSRILWLAGLEIGINCGPGIDSFERYIYIHGTHEEGLVGHPVSGGCIRMTNRDVIALYGAIPQGALVLIVNT